MTHLERTPEQQRTVDEEHVRLLGVAYLIAGGFCLVGGFFPLIYVAVGGAMMAMPEFGSDPSVGMMARSMASFMLALGGFFFLVSVAAAAICFLAGYWLFKKRSRIGCLIIAAIISIGFPFLTMLAVFTFIVLLRESVRDLFEEAERSVAAGADAGA